MSLATCILGLIICGGSIGMFYLMSFLVRPGLPRGRANKVMDVVALITACVIGIICINLAPVKLVPLQFLGVTESGAVLGPGVWPSFQPSAIAVIRARGEIRLCSGSQRIFCAFSADPAKSSKWEQLEQAGGSEEVVRNGLLEVFRISHSGELSDREIEKLFQHLSTGLHAHYGVKLDRVSLGREVIRLDFSKHETSES